MIPEELANNGTFFVITITWGILVSIAAKVMFKAKPFPKWFKVVAPPSTVLICIVAAAFITGQYKNWHSFMDWATGILGGLLAMQTWYLYLDKRVMQIFPWWRKLAEDRPKPKESSKKKKNKK